MEDILDKVEDFSDDEEILGAYDAEWHKIETERVVKLANREEIEAYKKEVEKEIQTRKEEIQKGKEEIQKGKEEIQKGKEELENQKKEIKEQGLLRTASNMLKENMTIELISKVTGLNIDQIEKLSNFH